MSVAVFVDRAIFAAAIQRLTSDVLMLARLKNVSIPLELCAHVADSTASVSAAHIVYALAHGAKLDQSTLWSINNCLDYYAARQFVDAFLQRRGVVMLDHIYGVLIDRTIDTLKGANPVGSPTWRWPDLSVSDEAALVPSATPWPLNMVELGATPLAGMRGTA